MGNTVIGVYRDGKCDFRVKGDARKYEILIFELSKVDLLCYLIIKKKPTRQLNAEALLLYFYAY